MLWYCRFRWHPNTTAEQVRRKVVEQHDAGKNHPDKIRGWYNLAGGGAGFMLIETDDPRELTDLLHPTCNWSAGTFMPPTSCRMRPRSRATASGSRKPAERRLGTPSLAPLWPRRCPDGVPGALQATLCGR